MTKAKRGIRQIMGLAALFLALTGCNQPSEPKDSPPASDSSDAATSNQTTFASVDDLKEVLLISDPLERVEKVARILRAADPGQLPIIKGIFEEAALDQGDVEYTLFIEWWAKFDPEIAFYYCSFELRTEYPRTALAAARSWARIDPVEAIQSGAFADQTPDAQNYQPEMLDAIIVGWFESGKPGLEEFIGSLTDVIDMTRGTRTYARMRVLRDGPKETLEWTREPSGFPAAHHRLLLAGALTLIAHQNPKLAVDWLPIAEADGIDIRTFATRIAGAWAHHEPEQAIAWVKTLPEGPDRNGAMNRVGRDWYQRAPKEFESWLDKHKGEAWVDELWQLLIYGEVFAFKGQLDWNHLLERNEQVVDDHLRSNARVWVLQHWLVVEPGPAEAWIDAHRGKMTETEITLAHQISIGDKLRLEKVLKAKAP